MDEVERIKDSVRQLMQHIAARGRPLTPELKDMLGQVLQHAQSRIQQLRQQQTITPGIPEGSDLLWQISGANPDVFARYMAQVPDPALNSFAQNPAQMMNLIRQFNQSMPPQQPIQQAGIEKAPLNSSNIWGFNYDPKSGRLKIRFQGDGIYEYEGVPPYIYRIFQAGAIPAKTNGQNQYGKWWIGKEPSLGSSFFSLIKNGGYPYHKVA